MWRLTMVTENYKSSDEFYYCNNNNNINQENEILLDSYRFTYNKDYYDLYKNKKFILNHKFTDPVEFHTKKNVPLKLLKLTEDSSMMITIHEDLSLNYWSYLDVLSKKLKNKSSLKVCPQCNSQLGSSKILCSLCSKKLCSQCKNVVINILFIYKFKYILGNCT